MKTITRLLVTAALLFVGVGGGKAGNYYATISVANDATWDAGTSTMGFTGVNGWQILYTGLPSGDITEYTKIHVTLSELSDNIDKIRLCVRDDSDPKVSVYYDLTEGENNIDLAALRTANPTCNFANINDITLWSPSSAAAGETVDGSHPASVKITDVYMQKPTDVVICTGFGEEITSLAGITDGTKFVISDNGTKALYFTSGDNNSKNTAVESVPIDAFFYYTLDKVTDSGVEGDIYRIKVQKADGTAFSGVAGGEYLNTPSSDWSISYSGVSEKEGNIYGTICQYGTDNTNFGLWYVTYDNEKGFSFQNVGKANDANHWPSWLKVDGLDGSQKYLKLYKSIGYNVNSETGLFDKNVEITVGGENRNYQLYVPDNYQENSPLVISLHGANGASTNYTPFTREVADAKGCIVAYPQGKPTAFPIGFGGTTTGWTATGEDNFDVKFLKAVIEDVASKYSINRKRIYCCGFSNGGMMTYAMANACSDEIAAFASISGYPINEFHLRHTGSRPVPFMHIHGTADDFVLYEKIPTIVDEMVARMGANPVPTTTSGTGYTKRLYAAGEGSFPFVYYEIDGMGHEAYTTNTEDGNSALTMWNFFKDYTLDSPSDETLKWAPRIEEAGFTPASHGWTVNNDKTLLRFGGAQYTTDNKNVYSSLQLQTGEYELRFTSTGEEGKAIGVKIDKLTSPYTVVLNTSVNAGENAVLPFEVTDGWGEYRLTMTRPQATDAITVTDIKITQTGAAVAPETIKAHIILTGSKAGTTVTDPCYGIEMQGWQSFVAYEDATGVTFNEDSYMQFDLDEAVSNGEVRVTFTFSDGSTRQEWWCLGIGDSKDDTSTPYSHAFDNSKYWLKKGLSAVWNDKKDLKITKVTINNFGTDNVFIYKVNGGTICGTSMTIKQESAKTFGYLSGEFSATDAQTNIFQINNYPVGDYNSIVMKFGSPAPAGWAYVYSSGYPPTIPTGATELVIPLNGMIIPDFTVFNWNGGDNAPDPLNISEVYLYKYPDYVEALEVIEAPVGTTDLNDLTGTETNWGITYPKVITGEAATLIGNGNGDSESTHVTVTGYDWLYFKIDEVTGGSSDLRVWVWDGSNVITLRPHPIADYAEVTDWTASYSISTPGLYAVKISDYDYLKGAKTNWGSSATLNITTAYLSRGTTPMAYVPSGKYTLTGEVLGSASLTEALADANATYYDAMGVTGIGLQMTPANPNALFKANVGSLTNTNNVIVGSTCGSLVLTDNHPFKAPANFTATAATYTTTLSNAAKAGTLCLPFTATIPEDVTAYTLTYSGGDEATATSVETKIPANTPVLLNGSGEKTFVGSGAVSASATNEAGALTGVFAATQAPIDSYVLQNGSEGVGFYIVKSGNIIVKPFRAYLTAQSPTARLAINYAKDEATGVKEVNVGKEDSYYNLRGQRVSKPSKGLYIVNGRVVMIK